MRRKICAAALIMLFLLISSLFAYFRSQAFTAQAASVLAAQASELLSARAEVSSVTIDSFRSVSVHDAALYDKEGRLFAKAGKAKVEFSLLSMLQNRDAVRAIDRIILEQPELHLVQRADSVWNYQDFISEEETQSNLKATLEVVDARADAEIAGRLVELKNINGMLTFISSDSLTAKLTAQNSDGDVEMSGTKNSERMALTLKAENINFDDYLSFVPEEMAIKVERGLLKEADVTVSFDGKEISIDGQTLILNAGVDISGTKIEDIDGLVLFTEKKLKIYSRAQLENQPLVLLGTTTLDVTEPVLDMEVSSKGFNVKSVIDTFPVEGSLAFKANVGGRLSNPLIQAEVSLPDGSVQGYRLTDVKGRAQYADKRVDIDELSGSVLGGRFAVSGAVDTENGTFRLHVDSGNIALDGVQELAGYGFSGSGGTDLDFYGKGTDLSALTVSGTVKAVNGAYQGIRYEEVDAGLQYRGETTQIDYALVRLPQGLLNAEGRIDGDAVDLKFAGSDVEMAQLAQVDPALAMRGRMDFNGTITRTLSNPWLTYSFKATDGEVFSQPFTWITGSGFGDGNRVDIERCEMHDKKGAKHEIAGNIGLKGEQPIDMTVRTKRTRAEHLFKVFLPDEAITGNVDNILYIGGSLAAPDVSGEVKLSEGSWRGMLLYEAGGRYQYKNSDLAVEDFVIRSPNLNLTLNGTLKQNERLDFAITADEIEMEKLQIRMPYPASGKASFNGSLKGTVDAPVFDGMLHSEAITLNGQPLTDIDGHLSYKNSECAVDSFSFAQGDGRFALACRVNLDTQSLGGMLSVENGSLKNILTMVNVEDEWVDGKLNGAVQLAGTLRRPRTRLTGSLVEGTVKGYPLDAAELDVVADGPVLTIYKLLVSHGGGSLSAGGSVNFLGDTDVKVEGDDIPVDLVAHLCGMDAAASGKIDFAANFSGSTQNPSGALDFAITGGGVGTATFDAFNGRLTLADRIIHVEKAEITKDVYKASAEGIVPWEAVVKDKDERASLKDQMDLMIRLDEADLQILPILSEYIEWAYGQTKGTLHLAGTLSNPLLNGNVHLKDGIMKCKGLANPIQNMMLDLEFKDDRISLNDLSGTIGNGSYKMTGAAWLDGRSFTDYDFRLDADQLDIVNAYYKGPFNGSFALTEENHLPKLSGTMNFSDCTIDIPLLPDSEEPLPEVALDIDVHIGEKVRLLNTQLCDMFLAGGVHAGGTTLKPDMSGEVYALKGKIYYLKTPFTIREARAIFNLNNTFLPSIRLFADTKMDRTRIFARANGTLEDMKFRLASTPPMSQEQIIASLTLRSRFDNTRRDEINTDDLANMLSIGLQMSFLSEMENMVRDNIGIDEFNIVRDTVSSGNGGTRKEVFNAEIGKYIDDKLMLKYTTGINYDNQQIGMEYQFDSRYSLNGEFGDNNTIMFESRIKF